MSSPDLVASSETALRRLDDAVRQLIAAGTGPERAEWHEALEGFASSAAQLERLLRDRPQPLTPPTNDEQLKRGIEALEAEVAAKDKLLARTQQQVDTWKQACDGLKQEHHANLYHDVT